MATKLKRRNPRNKRGTCRRRNPRVGYTGRGKKKIKPTKGMTWQKARLILHHGEVRGHPLTQDQRGMFGAWFNQKKPPGHSYEWYKKKAIEWGKKKKTKKKKKTPKKKKVSKKKKKTPKKKKAKKRKPKKKKAKKKSKKRKPKKKVKKKKVKKKSKKKKSKKKKKKTKCMTCKKPMRQSKGVGRPRLRHANCPVISPTRRN